MEENELELCNIMRKKCKTILKDSENSLDSIKGIRKNLYQLINSLQKFEKTPFADYMYLPIMLPLNMALDMMRTKDSTVGLEEVYKYFYDFMKAFNLCVQNSNRSDRQFTQTPEFNIRLYDIPTKMYAFYYAYVYNLREYLNEMSSNIPKHEYEFLICQGITNSLLVEKCFKKMSKEKGLFIIEIPERAAFEPQIMLLALTHELGHVVGTEIRQRTKRAEILEQITCKVICEYAKIKWKNRETTAQNKFIIDEEYWNQLEVNLNQRIFPEWYSDDFVKAVSEETQNRELEERIKEQNYYGVFVIQKILDRLIPYMHEHKEDIYGYLTTKQYMDWLDKEPESAKAKAEELRQELTEIIGDMDQYNIWNQDAFNIRTVLDLTLNLMRECLADIICIMTLQLSFQKYLEAIVVNLKLFGVEKFRETEVLLRSSLVTRCMLDESDNLGYQFQWNSDSLKDITVESEIRLKNNIIETMNVYLPKKKEDSKYDDQKRDVKSALGMLYTPSILEKIADYLGQCKEKYVSYCKNEEMQKKRRQLQNIYDMFGKDKEISIKNIVIEQQEYIEDYLYNLKKKMRMIKEDSDENR